jgi:hypothetical protein
MASGAVIVDPYRGVRSSSSAPVKPIIPQRAPQPAEAGERRADAARMWGHAPPCDRQITNSRVSSGAVTRREARQ